MKAKPTNVIRLADIRAKRAAADNPIKTMRDLINAYFYILLDQLAAIESEMGSREESK
jgi:hypothetical protein